MDSVKGLIPEIYYDMIARVAAGVPLVAIIISPSPDELERLSNATSFLFLIGLGYISGHLLAGVSVFINLLLWNPLVVRLAQAYASPVYKFSNHATHHVFDVVYQRIDWAANRNANAGTIMKKMEAGAALSDNLLSGWLIILLYQKLGGTVRWLSGLHSWSAMIPILITVVLIVSVFIRRWALIVRQDRLLKLMNYPGDAG